MMVAFWVTFIVAQDVSAGAAEALAELAFLRMRPHFSDRQVNEIITAAVVSLDQQDSALADQLRGGERLSAARRAELRARRCGLAFMRGELYRQAAELLPRADARRNKYAQRAIEVFKRLRIEYRDLAAGQLGYIGEARARRAMDDYTQADAALAPLLDGARGSGVDAQVRTLAELERLETLLAIDAKRALADAEVTGRRAEFRPDAAWHGQLEWLKARAVAASGDAAAAATMLRGEAVIAVAPAFERLGLLARLGAEVMEVDEHLAWADLLATAGRDDEALRHYSQAASEAGVLTVAQWVAFGRLLLNAGEAARAAECFGRALAGIEADDLGRSDALRYHAAALTAALKQSPDDTALAEQATAALLAVLASDAPDAARRAALKQWVAMQDEDDLARLLATLETHCELAGDDPFLRYAAIRAEWIDTRDDDELEPLRRLALDANSVRASAVKLGDDRLAAAAALLSATILASPPLRDAPAAVRALESHWPIIARNDAALAEAVALRGKLMTQIGLLDDAEALINAQPREMKLPSALLLDLAARLGERYDSSSPDVGLRGRVTALSHRALAAAAGSGDYASIARTAATALIRVEAFADAQQLVSPDDDEGALLRARALLGAGETDGAIALLEQVAGQTPKSPRPLIELGAIRASLKQHDRALAAYRQARELARPGTEPWWEATLEVVRALNESARTADARDVLRVALALHPLPERPTLQSQIEALRDTINNSKGTAK